MLIFAYAVFIISIFLILYHHIGYPLLLLFFSRQKHPTAPATKHPLNQFTFIIPMCNEAHFIAKKIANLAALHYPKDHYQVLLIDDGSTDNSLSLAQEASRKHPQLRIHIKSFPINKGKVAAINDIVPSVPKEHILFFSDVSSTLSANVLTQANQYFNQSFVGVYCPIYHLKKQALSGEKFYWAYQSKIKQMESKLGSPIGYHGAGYAIRKSTWQKLPDNAINDDLLIPFHVIEQGYVGVYDTESTSIENDPSSEYLDWHRRIRIGAGNIQQVWMLLSLLSPRYGYIAWMFFSGKVMRIIMPFLLLFLWLSNLYLAMHSSLLFLFLWWAQNLLYLGAVLNVFLKTKPTEIISYFVMGHVASFLGLFYLFKFNKMGQWQRVNRIKKTHYIHPIVFIGKWIIDKISGLMGLVVLILLFPFIAIGIKLSSSGPIFFRQLRVGQTTDTHTKLFFLYKFRTMRINSLSKKDRWTEANDPRIYPLGQLLRKTHLDELPQFLNILKGDMSLIGPRPERPSLFSYIIQHIPFYEERLYFVKPGLTGLAQITYRYDKTIEDVRRKVAYDHAYGIYLTKPLIWFKTEIKIIVKTITLVLLGKGF